MRYRRDLCKLVKRKAEAVYRRDLRGIKIGCLSRSVSSAARAKQNRSGQ